MQIAKAQLHWHQENAVGDGELSADASDLGLPPGKVPQHVEVTDGPSSRTYSLAGQLVRGDEVLGWSYWDDKHPVINLRIYND